MTRAASRSGSDNSKASGKVSTMTRAASRSGSDNSKASAALTAPSMTDLSFLGAPPLIPGESAGDYEQLVSAVTNTMKPVDFMETIWTRDIVDLQWDIMRFRRIKADLITHRYKGSHDYLDVVGEPTEFEPTPAHNLLASIAAVNMRGDIATTVAVNIKILERIDHMVMTMEARRNAAYREAERHRIGLGERLRRAAEQVEDAEFREVDDATAEQKHAA
jgi:hypothetical protein